MTKEKASIEVNHKKTKGNNNGVAGKIGLIGFIALGIVMSLFLVVDNSATITWLSVAVIYAAMFFLQRKISKKGFLANVGILVISAALVLVVFLLTSTMVSESNAKIIDGYMTNSVDSQGVPEDEVSSFHKNSPTLIAIGLLKNAPNNTKIRFVWTKVDSNQVIGDFSTSNEELGPNIYVYSYLTPKTAMEKGEYKVEIYMLDRDKPDKTIPFEITD